MGPKCGDSLKFVHGDCKGKDLDRDRLRPGRLMASADPFGVPSPLRKRSDVHQSLYHCNLSPHPPETSFSPPHVFDGRSDSCLLDMLHVRYDFPVRSYPRRLGFRVAGQEVYWHIEIFYIASSINIISDLLLYTSPMPLFWKIKIPLNERVMLCLLFCFGLLKGTHSVR